MNIDAAMLLSAVPGLPLVQAKSLVIPLAWTAREYRLDTPARLAMFLAQLGHESESFKYVKEIWGPTPQQLKYEPPSSLSFRLGNSLPGDGFRFRGRGWIQLTGRANYRAAGNALKLDLEGRPELAEDPATAFQVAAWYWAKKGLAALSDAGMDGLVEVTRRINGGLNGLEDRRRRLIAATGALRAA